MITNGEAWHYPAVRKLWPLLRGITFKYHGDFYCLNYLPSFGTENKCESLKNVYGNKYLCNFVMT